MFLLCYASGQSSLFLILNCRFFSPTCRLCTIFHIWQPMNLCIYYVECWYLTLWVCSIMWILWYISFLIWKIQYSSLFMFSLSYNIKSLYSQFSDICVYFQTKRISCSDALSHPYLDEGRLRYHSCMCDCCINTISGRHYASGRYNWFCV